MIKKLVFVASIFVLSLGVFSGKAYAKKNYTVTPKSIVKIAKSVYHSHTNKYSKHYLGFNAALEKMRKKGGGTLTVKKGTYNICNAITVPSNVKIVFKKGVVFKKINKTGIKGQSAAKSMWQLVPKAKSLKKNSVGKYNGSKNVKMIAQGKVVFDMGNKDGICIVVCHNDNVEISGITFKGMNGNHYVEINGSKNVNIHNNKFNKAKSSTKKKNYNKEAINIDTPDSKTHGLPLKWVKHDLTPCKNLTINKNTFNGTTRGVGTHKYSQKGGNNVYHEGIVITNNTFKNIFDNGVFVLNWKEAQIKNNKFDNIGKSSKLTYSSGSHGISGGGVSGISISNNTFTNIKRNPIYFGVQKNNKAGSSYKKVRNTISMDQIKLLRTNKASKCGNDTNSKFKGYHALIFDGNSEREIGNAIGVNFKTGKIWFGNGRSMTPDETQPVEPETKPYEQVDHTISRTAVLSLLRSSFDLNNNNAILVFEMKSNDVGSYDLVCDFGDLEYYNKDHWEKVEITNVMTNGETYQYSDNDSAIFTIGINVSYQGTDITAYTKNSLKAGKYRYWHKTVEGNDVYARTEFDLEETIIN